MGKETRCFFFSSRRRHTRYWRDWSSDVCSSDLHPDAGSGPLNGAAIRRFNLDLAEAVAAQSDDPALFPIIIGGDCSILDRKSVVQGKSVDLGGRPIIKKKK